ncbi:MAG TPA: hypothetical protein DEO65_18475 [Bacillus bacterium]|nr:hypothetical protein [Bacillus sp. (in: firmicutes)]
MLVDRRWPPQNATSCSFGGTRTSCPSKLDEENFFTEVYTLYDFINSYTTKKSARRRLALGDKHKANFDQEVLQPPQQVDLILSPMAPKVRLVESPLFTHQ